MDPLPTLISDVINGRSLIQIIKDSFFYFFILLFKISNQDVKLSLSDSVSGTPVCRGKYQGTARIVTRLSDAKLIQQGDVLITISTDIGWSPYFPLLGGVVTELGQYYDVFLVNDL